MTEYTLPGDDCPLTPEVASGVLDSLRWGPDQQIINLFGEHVWLKQVSKEECATTFVAVGIDPDRAYGYITDCCFVGDECERHRAMTIQQEENDR